MTCPPCLEGDHASCHHDPCGNYQNCELCVLCDCDHEDERAPKRVQMTRNKPWRAEHPDAVIVDRRTKWGNNFKVRPGSYATPTVEAAVDLYRYALSNGVDPWFERLRSQLPELRGKDLACWCKPGDSCHADVLLELANR